jgi:hypothetical protein
MNHALAARQLPVSVAGARCMHEGRARGLQTVESNGEFVIGF